MDVPDHMSHGRRRSVADGHLPSHLTTSQDEIFHSCSVGGHSLTEDEELRAEAKARLGNADVEDRRTDGDTTTNMQTLMHLLKGNIGTGVLAMASAFKNSGLATGAVAILVMGAICMVVKAVFSISGGNLEQPPDLSVLFSAGIHCMHILVRCSHLLSKIEGKSAMDYGEVIEASVRHSRYHSKARAAKITVDTFIVVSQFGFCCVYIVYIATTLHDVILNYNGVEIPIQAYIAMVLPFLILLSFIRSLKLLAPFSMAANAILCVCLGIIFVYVFRNLKPSSSLPQFGGWDRLPLFFGTAIYAFEGIGIILPIENRMKNPEDFGGWTGVLNLAMVCIAALYCAAGFFGYMAFGEDIKGSITLNLPFEGVYIAVILLVAVVIFYSYSLQFYVPMEILWPFIRKRLRTETQAKYGEYVFRSALVIFTFLLAVAIPKLDLFISLVGAVGSSFLALIFPPMLELCTYGMEGMGRLRWRLWKNIAIFLFGVTGFGLGTYVAIQEIVISFQNDAKH